MVAYLRHKEIVKMVERSEFVKLADIKAALGDVSIPTVKRDLKALEESGLIKRVRGGAVKGDERDALSYDAPMAAKALLNTQEKERIAKFAATLVEDGDVIFVDSGSTTTPVVRYLKGKSVTIVTSSVRILQTVHEQNQKIILVGGEYRWQTESVVGAYTETMLQAMYFDKAFIGASGFSETAGVTSPDFRESIKKQIICRNSKTAYFLMDGSKAGVRMLSKSLELREANLITDRDNELLKQFRSYYIAP